MRLLTGDNMIKVSDWIKESREIRTIHIDLTEECIERGGNSTVHRGVLAQFLCTDMPSKVDLCHACNNEKCSNPKHLYWGTRKENVEDARKAKKWVSPWEGLVQKYGIDKAKEILKNNVSSGWSKGGKANKGIPKSAEHKKKISESLKRT
jgi:hypothetical protein